MGGMTGKHYVMIAMFLGGLGTQLSSAGDWHVVLTPVFIGGFFVSLSGFLMAMFSDKPGTPTTPKDQPPQAGYPLVPVLLVGVLALGAASSSCAPRTASVQTPAAQRAAVAELVVLRVGEFQQAVIDASDAHLIPAETALVLVRWTVSSLHVLRAAPDGWGPTLVASWSAVRGSVGGLPALAVWVPALDAIFERLY